MALFNNWCLDKRKLYYLLFITIKGDMATSTKTVNTLINENIFPLKVNSLR